MSATPDIQSVTPLSRQQRWLPTAVAILPITSAFALAFFVAALSHRYPDFFDRLQGTRPSARGIPAIGEVPPAFTLQSTTQRWTTLHELPHPTLLIFYLGSSCPHCVHQFLMLNDHAADLAAHHVSLVGISSDPPMESLYFSVRLNLTTATLLSDPDHTVAARYGLYHPGDTIPLHALFLIDGRNRIAWESVSTMPLMTYDGLHNALDNLR